MALGKLLKFRHATTTFFVREASLRAPTFQMSIVCTFTFLSTTAQKDMILSSENCMFFESPTK